VEQRRPWCSEAENARDQLLIERLGELVRVMDPVPKLVEASARAAFIRRHPMSADPPEHP
jgi:hypothetical protein